MTLGSSHGNDPPERKGPDALGAPEARTSGGIGPDNLAPEDGERKGGTGPLDESSAARDYHNRIGARMRGLRSAVVEERCGQYARDVAVIRYSKEGDIDCSTDEHAPTDLERQLIKSQLAGVRWPKAKKLHRLINVPGMVRTADPANLFEFRDTDGTILMVQIRIETNGERAYVPWTFWDDDVWRMCEPEGPLPLFGLDNIKDNTTVFIHEGAKAARRMQEMVAAGDREAKKALADHPFGREMGCAVHVGFIGGAFGADRTNWAVLKERGIKIAYIVADNDEPGKAAVPQIAKHLRMPTFSVQFTDEFPKSFDLADDFPAHMFSAEGRYTGPSFLALLEPATWATDLFAPERGGKPIPVLRDHMKGQFVYADEPELLVSRADPRIIRSADNLSKKLQKFSDSPGTSRLLLKHCEHVTTLAYAPDKPTGIVTVRGQRAFNVYRPSDIQPVAGDPQPFLDFLHYLFDIQAEQRHVERWCATLIARPEIRMHFGLLLASKRQGVGKGILASQVLAPLVGDHNVGYPSEHDIVESAFNEWMAHKRLVVVGEIYQGQSFKAYNRMKGVITDRDFTVNKKHQAPYRIDNWCHVIACSNSDRALKMERSDRRWLYPQVTEAPWPRANFEAFVHWLAAGGLNIVAHWAEQYGDYLKTGEQPPMTARKQLMIEESEADELRWAREYCESCIEAGDSVVISSSIALAYAKRFVGGPVYSSKRDLGGALVEGGMAQLTKPDGQEFYVKFRNDKHRLFLSPAAQHELQTKDPGQRDVWLRQKLSEVSDALFGCM